MVISDLRRAFADCLELFWSTCYFFAFTLVIAALTFNVVYRCGGHIPRVFLRKYDSCQ